MGNGKRMSGRNDRWRDSDFAKKPRLQKKAATLQRRDVP
jgi:hypothetical protein